MPNKTVYRKLEEVREKAEEALGKFNIGLEIWENWLEMAKEGKLDVEGMKEEEVVNKCREQANMYKDLIKLMEGHIEMVESALEDR